MPEKFNRDANSQQTDKADLIDYDFTFVESFCLLALKHSKIRCNNKIARIKHTRKPVPSKIVPKQQ